MVNVSLPKRLSAWYRMRDIDERKTVGKPFLWYVGVQGYLTWAESHGFECPHQAFWAHHRRRIDGDLQQMCAECGKWLAVAIERPRARTPGICPDCAAKGVDAQGWQLHYEGCPALIARRQAQGPTSDLQLKESNST